MTKTQLRQLIKECLCEIDFAPGFRPTHDLTIVSTVTGTDVDHLKKYVLELHRVLTANFGNDVQFEEKLNMSRIDTAILSLSSTVAGNVSIYTVNYNVLRILSGMGGLAYSN